MTPLAIRTWAASIDRPNIEILHIPRGDSVRLSASLRLNSNPVEFAKGTEAKFYWQIEGMAGAWWQAGALATDGEVSVVWGPKMDTGAKRYVFAFAISSGETVTYCASGEIEMKHSPGAVPNEITFPPKTINFDGLTVLNPELAPWLDKAHATDKDAHKDLFDGKADLGGDGKVKPEQLPKYPDGLQLGDTDSTAHRGDHGKAAYGHSLITNANPHGVTPTMIGAATEQWVSNKLVEKVDTSSFDNFKAAISGLASFDPTLPHVTDELVYQWLKGIRNALVALKEDVG
jgi:hypothetical protein